MNWNYKPVRQKDKKPNRVNLPYGKKNHIRQATQG